MSPEAQRLEALLFLAGEAVSRAELMRLADVSVEQLVELLDELAAGLADHGLTIVSTTEHVQLTTAPTVSGFLKQYVAAEGEELSAAALETLSLVAYRGPITRPQLDAIRGVDSRRMIRQLLARGLVHKVSGTGRVPQYAVTAELLQQLGVRTVAELPQYELLSNDEEITRHLRRDGSS